MCLNTSLYFKIHAARSFLLLDFYGLLGVALCLRLCVLVSAVEKGDGGGVVTVNGADDPCTVLQTPFACFIIILVFDCFFSDFWPHWGACTVVHSIGLK